MPLFDDETPPVVAPPEAVVIQATAPEYDGITIDTRYVPAASLLTHVEGMSWTLRAYFSQVLGLDTPLSGQQLNLSPRQQQYIRINELEVKVSSDLKPTMDPDANAMVATGSANVFGGLRPNIGDMFIATDNDGRLVIFRVTNVDKKSMLKDAVYSMDYQAAYYAQDVYMRDFEAKTIKTLVFVSDYINYGQNPFLQEEVYNDISRLNGLYQSVMRMWFRSFLSNEYTTLLLPGQEISIYDHFLTMAVQAVFSTWDTPEVGKIRRLNVDDDETLRGTTLWNVILNCDRFMMQECMKRMGGVYTKRFTQEPMLEGIRYSGVTATVYPIEPVLSFDYQRTGKEKFVDQDIVVKSTMTAITDDTVPLIKPVMIDDYYVLSQAFYDQAETGQSKLELEVNKFLDDEALDNRVLIALAETYTGWGSLERFYYGALLMILIKANIRSI
jgi:hypothetical protein